MSRGGLTDEERALQAEIGHDLLGPVVHRWLLGLHQYLSFFADDNTAFLHCARAGVRIDRLYRTFLEGWGGGPVSPPGSLFWVSRVLAAKGLMRRSPDRAAAVIAREYRHEPISDLLAGLLRHHPDRLSDLDLAREEHKAHGIVFPGWLHGPTPEAAALRDYLDACSDAFEAYLDGLLEGRRRVVLIDSGWQGTMQGLLAGAYPERDWHGLYFGRILSPEADEALADRAVGLLFQAEAYDPARPETAFVLHRHLIESLLEPNGPSVEEVPYGPFEDVAAPLIAANRTDALGPQDALYAHVWRYLSNNAHLGAAEVVARHQEAMPELARRLVAPTRSEAWALAGKDRSADFGKSLDVPVLIEPDDPRFQGSDARLTHALWAGGQVALEYEGGVARDLQARAADLRSSADLEPPRPATPEASPPPMPTVAIITRTKNRPLLLRRAAESVARQTYPNLVWVVVNDGGDEAPVRETIAASGVDRRRIALVSNARSLGMEAASNAGIARSESDYLLIHDDDDALHPEFLARTVGFLEGEGAHYGGAITHSVYVSEEIRDGAVIEHDRSGYQDWVRSVHFAEMAVGNFFPPVAFLYRRSVLEDIGGYNEALPVLGDWYFNLAFLLRSDIGVIPSPLAYYHHRDRGDASRFGVYANSVIGGVSKHEEYQPILRNGFARQYAKDFPAALLVLTAYTTGEVRNQHDQTRQAISSATSHSVEGA
ncbi:MAG: glycosyltransferase, partial [Pseudomonadota bacterium]